MSLTSTCGRPSLRIILLILTRGLDFCCFGNILGNVIKIICPWSALDGLQWVNWLTKYFVASFLSWTGEPHTSKMQCFLFCPLSILDTKWCLHIILSYGLYYHDWLDRQQLSGLHVMLSQNCSLKLSMAGFKNGVWAQPLDIAWINKNRKNLSRTIFKTQLHSVPKIKLEHILNCSSL